MKTINTISIGLISLLFAATCMQAAEPSASTAPKTEWQNITAELCKTLGLGEGKNKDGSPFKPGDYRLQFHGMFVLPNGDVAMLTDSKKGIYRSSDQGATWAKYGEDWMTGLAQSSQSLKIYYPDRIALTLDGPIAVSSDLGKTWVKVKDSRPKQTIGCGDMDLAVNMPPKVILGAAHHGDLAGGMYALTSDGGTTWDWAPSPLKETKPHMRCGVVNATTLLRASEPDKKGAPTPGISRSSDLGKTWTKVSDYALHGMYPVHYGPNIYWTAKEGVVVSRDDGKTWSVYGTPDDGINFGPYFGKSEQEMMVVVSDKGYYTTRNGGQSWTLAAPFFNPHDGWEFPTQLSAGSPRKEPKHWGGGAWCFGWDSERNIIYASCFAGNAWKLQLGSTPAAGSGKADKK